MQTKEQILAILREYKKRNAQKYGIEDIGIFGSYARDEAKKNSDVDVFIQLKYSNLFLLSQIRIELEELLGIKTDIIQLRDKMNKYLKNNIIKEAISA